jgi:hypothetical protein
MRRWLETLAAVVAGLVLLVGTTIAVLIGLNAECNGPTTDCPRSAAYRYTLVALPVVAAVLLLGGAGWSIRRRSLRPLVLTEAAALAVIALVDAVLDHVDAGTVVLLAVAFAAGRAATR